MALIRLRHHCYGRPHCSCSSIEVTEVTLLLQASLSGFMACFGGQSRGRRREWHSACLGGLVVLLKMQKIELLIAYCTVFESVAGWLCSASSLTSCSFTQVPRHRALQVLERQ